MTMDSSQLASSPSYLNLLHPYLLDCELYGTCPPVTKLPAHQLVDVRSSTNTVLHMARRSGPQRSAIRAFNFNVNPLMWRHSTYKPQHATHSSYIKKHAHEPHQQQPTTKHPSLPNHHHSHQIHHYLYPPPHPHAHHHHHHHHHYQHHLHPQPYSTATSTSSSDFIIDPLPPKRLDPLPSHPKNSSHAIIMQRSLPIFEVLPPLKTSADNLLYQNSILLDGFKCDFDQGKSLDDDCHPKLRLDYVKFLKSIATKAHPSDREVIFGNAKLLLTTKAQEGWERSRIDWLADLEHCYEERRLQSKRANFNYGNDDELKVHLCCLPFPRSILQWDFI